MSRQPASIDTVAVLAELKDFQRHTVEHVHRRLWLDEEPARRFLVADEVGLGKTLVAKGVIARSVEHLRSVSADRIDVIYICSNAQIARQNLARLNISADDIQNADRLTLLAKQIRTLRNRPLNVVSLTPGTSFTMQENSGRVEERALILSLLRSAWGGRSVASNAWTKFFLGSASAASFAREMQRVRADHLDDGIAEELSAELESSMFGDPAVPLRQALQDCVSRFRYLREGSTVHRDVHRIRLRLIGRMRLAVAHAAMRALNPKLVILDEFQRFRTLLDPADPTAALAKAMFDRPGTRVLMLSATPYKMYTLPSEGEGEDHYADFEAVVEFLAGPVVAGSVRADLDVMRRAIMGGTGRHDAEDARDRVQQGLRRFMARTERLASTPDRDGMLRVSQTSVSLTASDVRAFAANSALSAALDADDVLEYWRSSPYLLNLMDDYVLKRRFDAVAASPEPPVVAALRNGAGLLDWSAIRHYRKLEPGNAKLRALTEQTIGVGAWKLAWLPPSLPYYRLSGDYGRKELQDFTKRLVFSAWKVAPKAIATLLSYEAQRATAKRCDPERRYTSKPAPLLTFSRSSGRLSGMPLLAVLYPSVRLAELGDPLALAREMGELPASPGRLQSLLRDRVQAALDALPTGAADGPVDQRWYWAAPFLLDAAYGAAQTDFLDVMVGWGNEGDDQPASAQSDHIREAAAISADMLGRRPDDLVHVLALLALAGPGVCALRALHRVTPGTKATDPELRDHATVVSWALRAVFNQPHVADIVRYGSKADAFWRSVLRHCEQGCLQAVLDEYVHVIADDEGKQAAEDLDRSLAIACNIETALTLRESRSAVDDIKVRARRVIRTRETLGNHFAVRFGRDVSDTDQSLDREAAVRKSFNSPFWPFVLASTSVGQEGLDFHLYCHAVVHWNLPNNPVDLEQREGRVHRFKNHAVRKNVARSYGQAVLDSIGPDPWGTLFQAAVDDRPAESTDIVPFWVFAPPGGAAIERYVLALPLSQESARYRRLQRTVGAYRMVLGQARQEDLLSFIEQENVDPSWLAIDLSPPSAEPAVRP